MNFTAKSKEGVCDAMRCTAEASTERHQYQVCESCAIKYDALPLVKPNAFGFNGSADIVPESEVPVDRPSDGSTEVAEAQTYALDTTSRLSEIKITSQALLDCFAEVRAEAKARYKVLEAQRTSITKPMVAAQKAANKLFKPGKDALDALCAKIDSEIVGYTTRCEDERLALLRAGEHTSALAVDEPELPKGVWETTKIEWSITDIEKLPPEFLITVVNNEAIDSLVKEYGMNTKIEGVTVVEVKSVRGRAAK